MSHITVDAPDLVAIGKEFDVPITIDNVVNLDAGQFDLVYDKTMIQLVGISNGNIGGILIPVVAWNENYSHNSMRVVVNVPGMPGVSGPGTLAVVRFKALALPAFDNVSIGIQNGFINDNMAHEIVSTYSGDGIQFFRPGDVNGDGTIDSGDIDSLYNIILAMEEATLSADVNGDGIINTADITALEIIIGQ